MNISKHNNWLIKTLFTPSESRSVKDSFSEKMGLKKSLLNNVFLKRKRQKMLVSTGLYEIPQSVSHDICQLPEKKLLRAVQRYTVNRSDQHAFNTRRLTKPFNSIYEIEWQQNQWLQLDKATCKYIDRLRRLGFSRVYIRQDKNLKAHMVYENSSEMDILLEVSLQCDQKPQSIRRPINCHLPSSLPLRRTKWWCTSYQTGIAYLPYWVDKNLCCDSTNVQPLDTSALSYYPSLEHNPSQSRPLYYNEPYLLS